ncbi:hypothetical protein NEOLEDRAFT_1120702 [Neolentinus lepideus HHB14362 ss-1]|uniref:MICOS complex subunit n=1 Tax=Neolentinus lepideus HHB14362 ss-1 TaxID=1314782 RepID=A0A165Q0Y7_9AGAM|nr:hypothetical protein NEOLEDRAFT_1120702 [Neolentinus lepideus HHB14362 ss-1]
MRIRVPRRALAVPVLGVTIASNEKEKLPIYPQPEPQVVVLDEPSELERQIGSVRRMVTGAYKDTHAKVQSVISRWIGVEHAVESRVKSLLDPSEEITLGLLYTTIATLSTSIVTRSRSLPIRFILPPTAFLVSFSYFLPKTTANISDYNTELEERYFPTLAEKHAIARAHSGMLVERIKEGTASGREQMGKGVGKSVDWMQGVTGLKIRETLGWNEVTSKSVTSEVEKLLERDRENVQGFAKDVADGVKGRTGAAAETVEEMAETDKGLFSRWGKSQASSSSSENPVVKAREIVGDVVDGTVDRSKAAASEVSRLAETDKKLAKEFVGDVAKETEARSKAAAEEIGKMAQTDKERAKETKEDAKKEVKKLV